MVEDNGVSQPAEASNVWAREYKTCPGCGSADRYFEGILNEVKARGLLPTNTDCFDFQRRQGIGLSPEKIALLPFGSKIPAFNQVWDTCCNCGLVYSVRLEKALAEKSIEIAPAPQPNRAQRRAGNGGNGFQLPPLNNLLRS